MFTVKHVQPKGHVELYQAVRVSYQPRFRPDGAVADPNGESSDDIAECIFIETPKGETRNLGSWGAFYVMNDAGKTIDKWDFGGWDGSFLPAAQAA